MPKLGLNTILPLTGPVTSCIPEAQTMHKNGVDEFLVLTAPLVTEKTTRMIRSELGRVALGYPRPLPLITTLLPDNGPLDLPTQRRIKSEVIRILAEFQVGAPASFTKAHPQAKAKTCIPRTYNATDQNDKIDVGMDHPHIHVVHRHSKDDGVKRVTVLVEADWDGQAEQTWRRAVMRINETLQKVVPLDLDIEFIASPGSLTPN